MPIQTTVITDGSTNNMYACNPTHLYVQTDPFTYYVFYGNVGVVYRKSTDGGVSWGSPVSINTSTSGGLSIWFDKWSGLSSGYIHVAYWNGAGTPYLYYRTVNTASSDALSTEKLIQSFTSQEDEGHITITRTRGGNVLLKAMIDNGVEGGFWRLTNANVPNGTWSSLTENEKGSIDKMILLPGFAADNQDAIAIYGDFSASELSRVLFDNSALTWSETSIATGMTSIAGVAYGVPQYSAAVDLTNSQIVLVAWTAYDTLNADLKCWTITESAITAKTDVVLNSTDDQGMCAIAIDKNTGHWYVFYCGQSDGSETYSSAVNVYYKVSTDSGSTWGAETLASNETKDFDSLFSCNSFEGSWSYCGVHTNPSTSTLNMDLTYNANSSKKARLILGI